ncbi:MAG: nuclear transport factor 2 family protein [Acidobacteria bacterium]|nr:nuclear transport factor 2 family protein [Acidobacteriota bacterium]
MDRTHPTDLSRWFAYGIDAIGRGDYDRGVAMWEESLADDFSFKFVFYPGGPSMECPGPECPIQEFDSRAQLRAQFAQGEFQRQGYLATQHQMHNVEERSRNGNQADVFAYIQANHFLPDSVVDIFWGDYTITCVEVDGLWQVQHEEIVGTSFVRFQGSAVS